MQSPGASNGSGLDLLTAAATADPLTALLSPGESVPAPPARSLGGSGHIVSYHKGSLNQASQGRLGNGNLTSATPCNEAVRDIETRDKAEQGSVSSLRTSPSGQEDRASSGVAVGFSGRHASLEIRAEQFKRVLRRKVVALLELRQLASTGIPDREGLRARTWKLLLNYLPPDSKLWSMVLAEKRAAYQAFCNELIIDPKQAVKGTDHPLSQNNDSKWNAFFKDAEMMEQIDRDVMRTHPDMHFFSGDDGAAVLHREEMKRVLFIFAKLNPGLRYVQGMNELLAPLYYQFRNDTEEDAPAHAEADAFYCFMDIIAEFRDHFCQQLDNSKVGIRATLSKLDNLLQQTDEELWAHLHKNKVNPQFYAFRWITLLLTQEFSFPDSVRLWDTLFSDRAGRYNCLLRLCCAMLLNVRDELLKGDFSQNLKMLQRYPPVDVHTILHRAANVKGSFA